MRILLLRLLVFFFITSFSVLLWHVLSNSAPNVYGPRYSEIKVAAPIKPPNIRAVNAPGHHGPRYTEGKPTAPVKPTNSKIVTAPGHHDPRYTERKTAAPVKTTNSGPVNAPGHHGPRYTERKPPSPVKPTNSKAVNAADLNVPKDTKKKTAAPIKPATSKDEKENAIIDRLMKSYSSEWRKHEANSSEFRSLLNSSCHALSQAIVTQSNTPVGSNISYDAEKKRKPLLVTEALFSTFIKEQPFGNATWDTCAVVGNGGILRNSSCAEKINSANLVIRCNLPPLESGYEKDVGNKTSLVTANPTILTNKFGGLMERRRPFVESLRPYGNSFLLLPAFSFGFTTPLSLRAYYTLEDFAGDVPRAIFFNPEYLSNLANFWRGRGLRAHRLSSGLMVTSLALELCNNVHLYGFWPFSLHPHGRQPITNHYYDNEPTKKSMHSMPAEFEHLLQLHMNGVIRLHLGECSTTDLKHTESKV